MRYPLDHVLGSPSHVRLLRVLAHEVDAPLGVSDLARLAGVTSAGARKALGRLEDSGVVERVGGGRTLQYGLRHKDLIAGALASLFVSEERRYDEFISSLRSALDGLHEMGTAWIEALPESPGDSIEFCAVVDTKAVSWIGQELRSRLGPLETEFDLLIEIAVFTRADGREPGPESVLLWIAEPDSTAAMRRQVQTHREADERALRVGRAVATLIRSEPALIKRAERYLDRLSDEGQATAAGDIAEWRQLLRTYSPERVRDLLVSTSSRADRLRQSSPFVAVLSADERDRFAELLERVR